MEKTMIDLLKRASLCVLSSLWALQLPAQSAISPGPEGLKERERLYTPADPAAAGGAKGVIVNPELPIEQILAIPPDEPRFVYRGLVYGDERRSFSFENLPMAKYDLIVIYADRFYEGLRLSIETDSLTDKDRRSISDIVNASDPFFNKKIIHRVAGTTGRGNPARCLVTQYRDGPGTVTAVYKKLSGELGRRTFKLIWLKDVGVGWQIVQKRDLYPVTVSRKLLTPQHYYAEELNNIRVTNRIKNLGEINLGKAKKSAR